MFDVNEYQRLAMRTSPDGHDRMLNGCMGLIGESGEVVDIVKKWRFQSGDNAPLPKDRLIEELGDVLWYCAEVSTGIKSDMMKEQKRWGLEDLKFAGELHIEALFLAKLCQNVTDAWYYPNDFLSAVSHISYTIAHIICLVDYMLHEYCDCTLERCMELNIEKLKRRYPDGFDPERSLHREE